MQQNQSRSNLYFTPFYKSHLILKSYNRGYNRTEHKTSRRLELFVLLLALGSRNPKQIRKCPAFIVKTISLFIISITAQPYHSFIYFTYTMTILFCCITIMHLVTHFLLSDNVISALLVLLLTMFHKCNLIVKKSFSANLPENIQSTNYRLKQSFMPVQTIY